ncbi:MAG: hypothetical protein QX199_19340 [Methylococcaceae bacterium]
MRLAVFAVGFRIVQVFKLKSTSAHCALDNSPILHIVDKAIQTAHSVDFNKLASGNCRANALISISLKILSRSVGLVVVFVTPRLAVVKLDNVTVNGKPEHLAH